MTYAKTAAFTADQQQLARAAKALAHPARVAILQLLASKTTCISGDIAAELPLARTTVAQHLQELKALGLILPEHRPAAASPPAVYRLLPRSHGGTVRAGRSLRLLTLSLNHLPHTIVMETPVFPRMHVSLYVADLAATTRFYSTFFGQEPTKVRPGYAKYTLDRPSLIISFVENAGRVASGFGHLGFQVETVAELAGRRAAAEAAGLVSREEIGTSCCYAKQDKFWVNDPDGVEWEVYYFHADAEFNDPRYQAEYDAAAGDSGACCIAPQPAVAEISLAALPPAAAEAGCGCGCGAPAARTLDPACC